MSHQGMTARIETREVLAGAYVRRNTAMFTHAAFVDSDGRVVGPVCDRVKADSLADRYAGNDLDAEPTCRRCARSWRIYRKERPDMFQPLGNDSAVAERQP